MFLLAPLVAGADVIGIALMAFLALAGAFVLTMVLIETIAHLPVIGSWFQSPVSRLADSIFAEIRSVLEAIVSPIVGLFSHPATQTDAHVKANVGAHVHHQQAANYQQNRVTVVADTVGTVQTQLGHAVGVQAAQQDVLASATQSIIGLDRTVGTVQSQLARLVDDVAGLSAEVNGPQVLAAIRGLQGVVGNVQSQLAETVQQLAGTNAHITSLAEEAAAAQPYTDTQVRAGVDAAEEQAARGDAAIRGDVLQGLRSGAPALPVDLTAALSGVAAAAVAAESFVKECGEPMCDWWHTNSNPLGNLLSLFGVAEMAALIAAGIADPTAVAHAAVAVENEFVTLGDDVLALFGVGGL